MTTPILKTQAPVSGAQASNPLLDFSVEKLHAAYRKSDFDSISKQFLEVIVHMQQVTYYALPSAEKQALNSFVMHFLYFMTMEDFTLGDNYAMQMIPLNGTIANIVAMSEFRNTDPYVQILLKQQRNFSKLLVLFSVHNRTPINRKALFDASPALATLWYYSFGESYRNGCADPLTLQNLRTHINFEDDRLNGINGLSHHIYFGATYIDHEKDYLVKQRINRLVQQTPLCKTEITNKPKKGRIAVLTSMWFTRQSVYRSQFPFLEALSKKYDLVLIKLGNKDKKTDDSIFSEVRHFNAATNGNDLSAIQDNDFEMAYFPDIGMSIESILLSNMRIAPIQVSNYGHPVSTFGAKVDYWIGGQETEDPERALEHYSERLVLIPGCAQAPVPLDYQLTYPTLPDSPIHINCTWSAQKINHEHLLRLREIQERAKTPVIFRFFPGGACLSNGHLPLQRAISEILGAEHTQVLPNYDFENYMKNLELAHFALDAYPFGGYNTAVDLLSLRQPIVTMAGNRFYNNSTAYLLNRMDLGELVTRTPQEYIDLAVRMIDNPDYRNRMIRRLKTADLDKTLLSLEHVPAFVRAIDHLLENHDSLKKDAKRTPITIH
jgi:predicted O-linked N-acetylglucosamine transferase (SPINDLY family)